MAMEGLVAEQYVAEIQNFPLQDKWKLSHRNIPATATS